MEAAIIEKEALQLPEHERALLADKLLESLSPTTSGQEAAWIREADERMAAFRAGSIEAIPGPRAMEDLRKSFSR